MTPARPSLADRLPRLSRRTTTTLWIIAAAVGASLAIIAVGATWRARSVVAASERLVAGNGAAVRLRVAALAETFARPGLVGSLSTLAAHLPPDAMLSGAERTPAGALRLTLDTTDPDALRASLNDDPWLRRFRERAEDQREDGGFRVTIEAAS